MITQHSAAQKHQSHFRWAVTPSDCHQFHQILSTCNLKTSQFQFIHPVNKLLFRTINLCWNDYLLSSTVR